LLQAQVPFDRRQLRDTVLAELTKRGLPHPTEFHVPDTATWERGWRNVARDDAVSLTNISFAAGLAKVKAFLDPLLSEASDGTWDPGQGRWTP
jgi:hypothetical protein